MRTLGPDHTTPRHTHTHTHTRCDANSWSRPHDFYILKPENNVLLPGESHKKNTEDEERLQYFVLKAYEFLQGVSGWEEVT